MTATDQSSLMNQTLLQMLNLSGTREKERG